MPCPRCGHEDLPGGTCPRCGVIAAKYRARPTPPSPGAHASAPLPRTVPEETSIAARLLLLSGLLLAAGLAAFILLDRGRARPSREPAPDVTVVPGTDAEGARDAGAGSLPMPAPDLASPPPVPADLDREDFALASGIAARLPGFVQPGDAELAEGLVERRPDQPRLRELLGGVLLALAQQDLVRRRFDEARARLERASTVLPRDARPHIGLYNLHATLEDWPRAESAVRTALEHDPASRDAQRALAYALFRQDRNREARELLRTLLAAGDDPQARALLERLERTARDEQGMTEQHLAHFHVRYDGEAHDEVGREILRALERHYATLVTTLDFQPTTVIPVILFSREAYYSASGAPAWSGGVFDQLDGRIRIPIGGLTASLSPEMDSTLLHELTHAFVHERTRGTAPRVLHEGLAQYLEGQRVSEADPRAVEALATGRLGGVRGFYLDALAFAEYLAAQRGQGGLNDLLRAMGESGDADRAFHDVYGRDLAGLQQAAQERLRRQAGA